MRSAFSAGLITSVSGGLVALASITASTSCGEATSITLEITTNLSCHGSPALEVGIATGDLASIDGRPFSATKSWCEPSAGRIGSLVLVPSGADDAEVAVRVVAGIGRPADSCEGDFAGCIVERRIARFVPNTNVLVTVLLSEICVGVKCGAQQTCRDGLCVGVAGVTGAADAGRAIEAGADAGVDSGRIVDASVPPKDAALVCAPVSGATACCAKGIACVGDANLCGVASQCAKCVDKCGADPDNTRCCLESKIDSDGLPKVTCRRPSEKC